MRSCLIVLVLAAPLPAADNLIPNGRFRDGDPGGLPTGWKFQSADPALAPLFDLVEVDGERLLRATGGGNPDCVGHVSSNVPITLGKTYRLRVVFRMSPGLNPHQHLLF